MEAALPAEAKKAASPLLAALHDTATDLHKAGFMDLRSLREYDALCLAVNRPGFRGGCVV